MAKELVVKPTSGFRAYIAGSDLYKEVEQATAAKFGKDSRAYATIMKGINTVNATGSQFFFNNEAGLYLPRGQRVATFEDLDEISKHDNRQFFDGSFYTDTPELVLRTEIPSWMNNTQILEHLVSQTRERGLEFSSENPLVLSGLELVSDDNQDNFYGILANITDETKTRNDPRFAYGNDQINLGNKSRKLWTKENGLSRVFLGRDGDVVSSSGDLSVSYDLGRVVIFDAEGVTNENEELESLMEEHYAKLRELRDRIDSQLPQ